jgi:hypothetical protein
MLGKLENLLQDLDQHKHTTNIEIEMREPQNLAPKGTEKQDYIGEVEEKEELEMETKVVEREEREENVTENREEEVEDNKFVEKKVRKVRKRVIKKARTKVSKKPKVEKKTVSTKGNQTRKNETNKAGVIQRQQGRKKIVERKNIIRSKLTSK